MVNLAAELLLLPFSSLLQHSEDYASLGVCIAQSNNFSCPGVCFCQIWDLWVLVQVLQSVLAISLPSKRVKSTNYEQFKIR